MRSNWEAAIEQLLDLYHWQWMHMRPAQTVRGWRTAASGCPGWPDYYAMRVERSGEVRTLVIEAKGQRDKPTPDQQSWLDLFSLTDAEVYVWRPSDREEMEKVLK